MSLGPRASRFCPLRGCLTVVSMTYLLLGLLAIVLLLRWWFAHRRAVVLTVTTTRTDGTVTIERFIGYPVKGGTTKWWRA